jgi:hypothetical protein
MNWMRMFIGLLFVIFGLWIGAFAGYLMNGDPGASVNASSVSVLVVGLAISAGGVLGIVSGARARKS